MFATLNLALRRQTLEHPDGFATWTPKSTNVSWPAEKTALVLCDVWDRHTCRGAEARLERMLPTMERLVTALREKGALIVHAPSDTMPYYEGTAARKRAQEAPQDGLPAKVPESERRVEEPPQPLDQHDACDTCPDDQHPKHESGMPYPWTREHPAISVDEERDAVSADGHEHLALFRQRGIEHILLMGVHTNMCILRRTFSIKQMVKWEREFVLIRDMTDVMYNPARPPYVSHDEGTRLTVEYIEKFWCPTVTSDLLLG